MPTLSIYRRGSAVYAADLVTCLLPSAHPQKVPVRLINAQDELQLLKVAISISQIAPSMRNVSF